MKWATSHRHWVLSAVPPLLQGEGPPTPSPSPGVTPASPGLIFHAFVSTLLEQKQGGNFRDLEYNQRRRWRRLERLIKNVMIPFVETALFIMSRQQACNFTRLTWGVSLSEMGCSVPCECESELESLMDELGSTYDYSVNRNLSFPDGRIIYQSANLSLGTPGKRWRWCEASCRDRKRKSGVEEDSSSCLNVMSEPA